MRPAEGAAAEAAAETVAYTGDGAPVRCGPVEESTAANESDKARTAAVNAATHMRMRRLLDCMLSHASFKGEAAFLVRIFMAGPRYAEGAGNFFKRTGNEQMFVFWVGRLAGV